MENEQSVPPTINTSVPRGESPLPNFSNFQQPQVPNSKPKTHNFILVFLVIVLVFIVGGSVYAFVQKIGPFSVKNAYTEENFLSNLVTKVIAINSATYGASVALYVGARDSGPVPDNINVTTSHDMPEMD